MDIRDYIKDIQVHKVPVREIFDEFQNYINEDAQECTEWSEERLYGGLVSSIRHTETNYNAGLKELRKIDKSRYAYKRYRNAVLEQIAITYPFLAKTCNKQKHRVELCRLTNRERFRCFL